MAENASAIREALEEKRSGVAETLATGQKADVRDRLAETAREVGGQAKEHLAEYATQAKSKASELRDQADQLTRKCPSQLRVLVANTYKIRKRRHLRDAR